MATRANAQWAKFLLWPAMICACSAGPDDRRPVGTGEVVTTTVGPAGGQLTLEGVDLSIPPGALSVDVEIAITSSTTPAPLEFEPLSPLFDFQPDGLQFSMPASVTIQIEGDGTQAGLYWIDSVANDTVLLASTLDGDRLTADIEHFSRGFGGTRNPCGADLDNDPLNCGRCGKVCPVVDGTATCAGGTCAADGCAPAPEVCNDLDDDCDGSTDEGDLWANKGSLCLVGQGACQTAGVFVCDVVDPSRSTVCDATPGVPSTELCTGVDDDCDGATDEFVCSP